MSIFYLAVAKPEDAPQGVSTTTLVEEILRRWPDARIELPDTGPFSVRWTVGRLSGELYRHGRGIALSGDQRDVEQMVIAFRRLLGKDLTFTDEGYYGSVVVTETMSVDELDAAYDQDVERHRRVWYLVDVPASNDAGLQAGTVAEEVDRRWPDATITNDARGPFAMWWSARTPGGYFDGKLSRDGRRLSIAGSFEAVADFAIWVRRAVGGDVAFTDDRATGSVTLTASMTADELSVAYKAAVR